MQTQENLSIFVVRKQEGIVIHSLISERIHSNSNYCVQKGESTEQFCQELFYEKKLNEEEIFFIIDGEYEKILPQERCIFLDKISSSKEIQDFLLSNGVEKNQLIQMKYDWLFRWVNEKWDAMKLEGGIYFRLFSKEKTS